MAAALVFLICFWYWLFGDEEVALPGPSDRLGVHSAQQLNNNKSPDIQNLQHHQPSFCGEKKYGKTRFTCNERLNYMRSTYHISEHEAKNVIFESKDCICDCLWGYKEECFSSSLMRDDCICDVDDKEEDMMLRAPENEKESWGSGRWQRMLIGIFSYDSLKEFEHLEWQIERLISRITSIILLVLVMMILILLFAVYKSSSTMKISLLIEGSVE